MTRRVAPPAPRSLGPDREGGWVRHWRHPQWLASADDWVGEQLAVHGMVPTGPGVTYKIRFWSVVRCYPTDTGLVWFKENNPGQAFEASLVAALADLVPDLVVRPLSFRADTGWLLSTDQGTTLGDSSGITDQATRLRLVDELARFQRICAEHERTLHAAGITTAGPQDAGRLVRDRLGRLRSLPATHPLRPHGELTARLHRAAGRLEQIATELDPRIPLTLDHNDLHAYNVFGDAQGGTPLRFFDFGDAVWGHPFGAMHSLVNSLVWTAGLPVDDPQTQVLVSTYLEHWSDLADLDTLRHDYRLVNELQPVPRLVSWHRLLDHADLVEINAWLESPTYWLGAVAKIGDADADDPV